MRKIEKIQETKKDNSTHSVSTNYPGIKRKQEYRQQSKWSNMLQYCSIIT